MPPEREDDISDDVDETESLLARRVGTEMNWQEEVPQLPPSPLAAPPSPSGSPSGKTGKTSAAEKVKKNLKRSGDDARKEGKKTKTKKVVKTNSEMFPASMRPEMFADDDIFDDLPFDKAATFVHEHKLLTTKLEAKAGGKSAHEKSDDTIKKVKIPEGDDDAGENLNIEARKALRPVNKEISKQMSWFVTKYEQVIRNIPVDIYRLADSVPTKAIELAYNLASHITIDMFCPGGEEEQHRQAQGPQVQGRGVRRGDDGRVRRHRHRPGRATRLDHAPGHLAEDFPRVAGMHHRAESHHQDEEFRPLQP